MDKLKVYCEDIDIILFNQMTSMIAGCTEVKIAYSCDTVFEVVSFKGTIQGDYGLRYPGEVLERYTERIGPEISKLRAIALALGEMKKILSDNMFIGNQYDDFIKKIKTIVQSGDKYLCAALYLLEDNYSEKEKWYQEMFLCLTQRTEDIVFLASVLRGRDDAWECIKPLLNSYFGAKRTIKVYGNIGIYVWTLNYFWLSIKGSRDKNSNVLRLMLSLINSFVKDKSEKWKKLREQGYTCQEILYLNSILPRLSNVANYSNGLYRDSITCERIALETCKKICGFEEIEASEIIEECKYLLKYYEKYTICLEGMSGIIKSLSLYIDKIRSTSVYDLLYSLKDSLKLPIQWFFTDIVDEKWDEILLKMEYKQFLEIIDDEMYYKSKSETVDLYFAKFKRITNMDYLDTFWNLDSPSRCSIFKLMVVWNKINLNLLFEEYVIDKKSLDESSLKKKWEIILKAIYQLVRDVPNRESFLFWQVFINHYGVAELPVFFNDNNIFYRAFNLRDSKYGFDEMKLTRNFLSDEEQLQLIMWVNEYVFKNLTKQYRLFVISLLLHEVVKKEKFFWRELFDYTMFKFEENASRFVQLRKKFYSDKEWQGYKMELAKKKEETEENEKKSLIVALREELFSLINDTEQVSSIVKFLQTHKYSYRESYESVVIVIDYISEHMNAVRGTRNDIYEIIQCIAKEKVDLKLLKKVLGKMEISI